MQIYTISPNPTPHTPHFFHPTIIINSLVELKFKKYILKSCAIDWFFSEFAILFIKYYNMFLSHI